MDHRKCQGFLDRRGVDAETLVIVELVAFQLAPDDVRSHGGVDPVEYAALLLLRCSRAEQQTAIGKGCQKQVGESVKPRQAQPVSSVDS